MLERMMLMYANLLERHARKIKKKIKIKKQNKFLDKYNLIEKIQTEKKDMRFNSYEGTDFVLLDTLIESRRIQPEDVIMDVGCGTGIFLLYLASHGFNHLKGVEFDRNLYTVCSDNINKYKKNAGKIGEIKIVDENALETKFDNDITCFYLFNTFYDQDTYTDWLHNVERSLLENPRHIKIIILYPTVASMGAMRKTAWLQETGRVMTKAVKCYNCMHFIVYEGGENFGDFTNLNY